MFPTRSAVLLTLITALTTAAVRVSPIASATNRINGSAVKIGDGEARSYILYDAKSGAPTEIGVAFTAEAVEGRLPSGGSGHHDGAMVTHEFVLPLPEANKTPFKFVELNWNPMGHEPNGVYQDVPHFDFHFYTISKAERDAIMPSDPQFKAKANNIPGEEYVPQFNVPLAPPGATAADVAVPMMGLHWLDVRTPELQKMLGKPEAYKPFTTTFLHGSWDGRFTFWEPMITRAYILSKKTAADDSMRDERIALPLPKKYKNPGFYPTSYRITWDAEAREYRVALTDLTERR